MLTPESRAAIRDPLGNRMKRQYENRVRYYLPRRTYTVIRVDGKSFHSYTAPLNRPFDEDFMKDMAHTASGLIHELQGARFAFLQSDEVSFLLTDFESETTEAWFDGNVQKQSSVAASLATGWFNIFRRISGDARAAFFDARTFSIPDPIEVENYFIWRQRDAERNSLQMLAHIYYSHHELQFKKWAQIQDMLMEKGANWNDLPTAEKRGRIVTRDGWIPDDDPEGDRRDLPIFTRDRTFLRGLIPVLPGFKWDEGASDENRDSR